MNGRTVRRDTLLKLARTGRLIATGGYSYTRDEPQPGEYFKGRLPVHVIDAPDGTRTHPEGLYNIGSWDFTGNCGHAHKNPDGSIYLHVHSNCNHTFVVVPLPAPVVHLCCCCCGQGTRGRQWWNRDTGYGICPTCYLEWVKKDGEEETQRSVGKPGVHHSLPDGE